MSACMHLFNMGIQSRADSDADTVTVSHEDGWWVARDEETGVASQGKTKVEALANLAEALELHERETPDSDALESSTAPWL